MAAVRGAFAMFPDRRKGKNKRYTMVDAALSAFAVFFTQSPSWLAHQKAMEKARGKSNALTLFRVAGIPTENRVRDLLDPLSPRLLDTAFARLFRLLEEAGVLAGYTGVGGHGHQNLSTLLAAMNILAFLLHTVLGFTDADYKLVREELPSRETFFQHVKALTTYLCFPSWRAMLDFMMKGLEIGPYLPPEGPNNTRQNRPKTKI